MMRWWGTVELRSSGKFGELTKVGPMYSDIVYRDVETGERVKRNVPNTALIPEPCGICLGEGILTVLRKECHVCGGKGHTPGKSRVVLNAGKTLITLVATAALFWTSSKRLLKFVRTATPKDVIDADEADYREKVIEEHLHPEDLEDPERCRWCHAPVHTGRCR
jgi:hypothetical protein